MKNEPCAKLTMCVTPKISDRPAATRNRYDASANPLSSWTRRPERFMGSGGWAHLPDFGVRRLERHAVAVTRLGHHASTVGVARLADERTDRRLVVDRAVGDAAERRVDLQVREGRDEL